MRAASRKTRFEELRLSVSDLTGDAHVADEPALVVMLHIPRAARLADPLNQVEIVDPCIRTDAAVFAAASVNPLQGAEKRR